GPMANDFHLWFSSKYLDAETRLYYYGRRSSREKTALLNGCADAGRNAGNPAATGIQSCCGSLIIIR
ncbi:MAG: hypothetical protein C0404_11780, partial [Verrucomicrobia bacterium]|nr:hypothetical protein [Verrucomicrobiota bacterium]